MDYLTVGKANSILETGQTTKELSQTKIGRTNSPLKPNGNPVVNATDFTKTLKEAIGTVNQLHQTADRKMQELATGKSQNVHETMIAAEKADIALRLMVQVRNKMIDAYQEIMRMQV